MLQYHFGKIQDGDAREKDSLVKYLTKLKAKEEEIIEAEQVHGDLIYIHTKTQKKVRGDVDGLITTKKNTALVVRTADCLPIIYADVVSGIIGISHQGWRGLLKELPSKMVAKMVEVGADKKNIGIFIGPGADVCCYEVSRETARLFVSSVITIKFGKPYLDMKKLAMQQLESAGVPHENIIISPDCTIHQSSDYFSYRESKNKEDSPRNFNFVLLS